MQSVSPSSAVSSDPERSGSTEPSPDPGVAPFATWEGTLGTLGTCPARQALPRTAGSHRFAQVKPCLTLRCSQVLSDLVAPGDAGRCEWEASPAPMETMETGPVSLGVAGGRACRRAREEPRGQKQAREAGRAWPAARGERGAVRPSGLGETGRLRAHGVWRRTRVP